MLDIISVFKQMFEKNNSKISIKEIDPELFLKIIGKWDSAVGYYNYNNGFNSEFACISDCDIVTLKKVPPVDNLFSIREKNGQVGILENYRLEFKFNNTNRRDIVFKADSSTILKVSVNNDTVLYFIIDNLLYKNTGNILKNSPKAKDAVKRLLLKKELHNKKEEKDIVLKLDNPDNFTAGRFFLPKIISVKPELTTTEFIDIRASLKNEWIKEWKGLCYKITFSITDKEYGLYYLFDMASAENIKQYKEMFLRLLKIIFKNNRKNLTTCGINLKR